MNLPQTPPWAALEGLQRRNLKRLLSPRHVAFVGRQSIAEPIRLCRNAGFAESERERLIELDVNPLFVLPRGRGVVAVDGLIVRAAG